MSSPGGLGCALGPVVGRVTQICRHKRALILAKATTGTDINPTGKVGKSRSARFGGVMNYGN